EQIPEYIGTRLCSHNLFPMLGVEAAAGRLFSAGDDAPNAQATAVLMYGLWKRRFGQSPAVIGSTIRLDSQPYPVIGVLPQYFNHPDTRVQLWLPVYHEISPDQMHFRGNHRFLVWARLRPGVSVSQAYAELDGIEANIHRQFPDELTGTGAN